MVLFRFALLVVMITSVLRADSARTCIIITGLGGMPEYEENFVRWATGIEKVFREELKAEVRSIDARKQKRTDILKVFDEASSAVPAQGEVWLFLVGHGNHDGKNYRFNISGPDLTDEDLNSFLNTLGDRRACVVAATGASGILIPELSKKNRVLVTATKNEFERQPPLFLSFFLEAITSAQADLDMNGKVSLLEAFNFSQAQVKNWFEEKGRLQTEHPLLDDNGDGKGTPQPNRTDGEGVLAAMVYLSAPPAQAYKTLEAKQLANDKIKIERDIEDLKYRKKDLPEAEYYQQLENLLVQLSKLNAKIEELEGKK